MRKSLLTRAAVMLLSCSLLISCGKYTAEEYIDDLKDLMEETAENASSYDADDWKDVLEEFKEINEKAADACKDMTEEQAKEIKKLKKELSKKISNFNAEKAGESLKGLFSK